ncbi:MAG: hypothetical protein K2G45_03650 [Lachnospiraceae bacterium]|nr:hypothetical protein [Lachnospiraceae bacterium]
MEQENVMEQENTLEFKKRRKKKRRKKIIPKIIVAIMVVAVSIGVYYFFIREKSAEEKIESRMKQYTEAVKHYNTKKLVELTVPKDLAYDIAVHISLDAAFKEGAGLWSLTLIQNDFDMYYDAMVGGIVEYLSVFSDVINIKLENFKVTGIQKADVKPIVETFCRDIDSESLWGYKPEEAYELVKKTCEDYFVDLNKVYRVDISYNLNIDAGNYENVFEEFEKRGIDIENMIDHMYAFEYAGDYYFIPGIESVVPMLFKE